ncbi:MAG: hypothetical protein ACRDA4_00165 [Filifactoraceae bacterium]
MRAIVINNLLLSVIGSLLFLMAWSANTVAGLYYSIGKQKLKFNKSKLKNSFIKVLSIIYVTLTLTTVITVIPVYYNYAGINLPQETTEDVNALTIIGVYSSQVFFYYKDCLNKLTKILKSVNEEN